MLTAKRSPGGESGKKRSDSEHNQTQREPKPARTRRREGGSASTEGGSARAGAKRASKRPRIRASHAGVEPTRRPRRADSAKPAARRSRAASEDVRAPDPVLAVGPSARHAPATVLEAPLPGIRKAPLTGPRRAGIRRTAPPPPAHEASAAARDLALAVAAAGLEKKALGIEILDVSGKVDYAEFLVIMTGRSDRHVHAIANGLEEALHQRKVTPLSIEGLEAATWVLIDFGDVVVHVFQEDARRLYDIEGLWIDANRIPVPPEAEPRGAATQTTSS